ncbi:MAG: glycosyltransferase family 1 protein [Patescibacteria group bacterium]
MKIIIDISQSVYTGTGVARFTINFAKALTNIRNINDHEITFFFSSLNHKIPTEFLEIQKKNPNIKIQHLPIPPRALSYVWGNSTLRNLWPQMGDTYDLFVSSDWAEPPPKIAKYKSTIIHDLIFKRFPETVDPIILSAQTQRLENVTKETDIIFCDSESTLYDLKNYYPNTKGQVVVNYPGVDPLPSSNTDDLHFNSTFASKKYFLSVGKLEPRKNIPLLVDAFTEFRKGINFSNFELVIVGPKGWDVSENNLKRDGVHFLGAVTDIELEALYRNALAFVYPTIYEGFGIPPLEAMLAGCPVIMSRSSSLVEIADENSAKYVAPNDKQDLIHAMQEMSNSDILRNKLIENGLSNVKRFTWDKYVDKFISEISKLKI